MKREKAVSVFHSRYIRELPLNYHLMYRLMGLVPAFRDMIRLLRYRF